MKTAEARLWARVMDPQDGSGCLLWTGSTDKYGYGQITVRIGDKRYNKKTHHLAWYLAHGEWPKETLNHKTECMEPRCLNVEHLEEMSNGDNVRHANAVRGHHNSNKTHCRKGHAYTEENTRYGTRGDGRRFRICKTCDLIATHKRRGAEKTVHTGPKRKVPGEGLKKRLKRPTTLQKRAEEDARLGIA